jgi:hypothetical protein
VAYSIIQYVQSTNKRLHQRYLYTVVDIVFLENDCFFGSFQYIILLQKAYHWLNDATVMQLWSYKNDVCQLLLFISLSFYFQTKTTCLIRRYHISLE